MKVIFIGHRGVGKTSLLKNFNEDYCYDLDQEIEKKHQLSVSEIFQQKGEAEFRKLEKECFEDLSKKQNYVISLGAGANFDLPKEAEVIWLQRLSDLMGRIFLDRPRLNSDMSPLDEFKTHFSSRERKYNKQKTQTLLLPEGDFNLESFVKDYLQNKIDLKNYSLTLSSENLNLIETRSSENISLFEIRDDLLSLNECQQVLDKTQKVLLSFRTKNSYLEKFKSYKTDWAMELGTPPFTPNIVSAHSHKVLNQAMAYKDKCHIKWAPMINSWAELVQGHNWWLEAPEKRSFLPRSNNGQWYWYRLMWGHKMQVKFYKEDRSGSAPDQPSLYQVHNFYSHTENSYAVIGKPVLHSWTPEFHKDFFKTNGYAMEVGEEEFDTALATLKKWKATSIAVTSPLKQQAAKLSKQNSVNTLLLKDDQWHTQNTDLIALKNIFENNPNCVLWGGGGIRSMVMEHFPDIPCYSSRTGECLNNKSLKPDTTLIWAVPNQHVKNDPPFKPKKIIDLNYFENSLARAYALKHHIPYESGKAFFVTQAQAQQNFWKQSH